MLQTILGVERKANNIACRGKLGKLPLIIKIYKQLFKYIAYINLLPESKIAKQVFLISKYLCHSNSASFYGNAMNILKTYNSFPQIQELESIS